MSDEVSKPNHFIRQIIQQDVESGQHGGKVVTRFPPEPNGYLHVGHAKAICVNFTLAADFCGECYLRFDDTNPEKDYEAYMQNIIQDIEWLGFTWVGPVRYSSDYFEELYQRAIYLIKQGKAYVDSLSAEQMRAYRGTLKEPGQNSPDRERSVEDNLALFEKMHAGECADGAYILRAKIDMTSGNMNLRDPAIYRIKKTAHPRTGDTWCIYPMYDFCHPLSDSIEGVTHSLCSLEFQDHRPLYDWFIQNCDMDNAPQQIEFSRLNLNYTITSKRKLKRLVDAGVVSGWDDPRMPTLVGLRRRGFTPRAIRQFCERLGVSKQDSMIDMSVLEDEVRRDLDACAPRRMVVLNPLKVVIENFPENEVQQLSVANHPKDAEFGWRDVPFTQTLYIDRDDFMLDPPKKYFRLSPGKEVRLLNAYVIRCDEVIRDESGEVCELRCHYDKDTLGGKKPADGRKVKGVIQWVSASYAQEAQVRLYDRLFNVPNPSAQDDFLQAINPDSLRVLEGVKVEGALTEAEPEAVFQFSRIGYFCADRYDYRADQLVFNQIVPLRSVWDIS